MDPNHPSKNHFLNPDYLDENEKTKEEKLMELALEMTRNGSLTILGGGSSRSRNPIMRADFVEAQQIAYQDHLNHQEAEEIRRDAELRAGGVMQPHDIIEVTRVDTSDYSKPLQVSYRTELHNSNQLNWDGSRDWNCSFCGGDMHEYSWSFPNINLTLANCSLHLLLNRIGRDFFPGAQMILNATKSHLKNPRFIKFVFDQIDEQSNVMSTTWVDMRFDLEK